MSLRKGKRKLVALTTILSLLLSLMMPMLVVAEDGDASAADDGTTVDAAADSTDDGTAADEDADGEEKDGDEEDDGEEAAADVDPAGTDEEGDDLLEGDKNGDGELDEKEKQMLREDRRRNLRHRQPAGERPEFDGEEGERPKPHALRKHEPRKHLARPNAGERPAPGAQVMVVWGNSAKAIQFTGQSTDGEVSATDWSGSFSSGDAGLHAIKLVRFDQRDSFDRGEMTFESTIGGGVDGVVLALQPEEEGGDATLNMDFAYTGELAVSLSELKDGAYKYEKDGYAVIAKLLRHHGGKGKGGGGDDHIDRKVGMLEVRWGNDGSASGDLMEFDGSLSISAGKLKLAKEMAWEKNDEVTADGSEGELSWMSKITTHIDGLLVKVKLDESGDEKPSVTLKLNDFEQTYTGENFGRTDLGDGYFVEVMPGRFAGEGTSDRARDAVIEHRGKVADFLAEKEKSLEEFKEECRELHELVSEYNSVEDSSFDEFLEGDLELAESAEQCRRAKDRFQNVIVPAQREAKFRKGVLDFKDVDDNQWFAEFASKGKQKGVFAGFKDDNGNSTGEFGPSLNVRRGEVLKVAAILAGKDRVSGQPRNEGAVGQWFAPYVKAAEDNDLDISTKDIGDFATRGEVLRAFMEFFEADFSNVVDCGYSDVAASNPDLGPICLATELGIVSGDTGKSTFRPGDRLTRAEFAKIYSKFLEVYGEDYEEAVEEVVAE